MAGTMIKREFYGLCREHRDEAAELLMVLFGDLVNVMGDDEISKALLEGFLRQHRTLQQSIARATLDMFLQWAALVKEHPDRYVDLRNEDAAAWAKSLAEDETFVYNGKACMRSV